MIHQPHGASRDTPALRSPSLEHVRQLVCRRVSVGMWVYCLETVGELWLMNSCAPASDTPADLSNVVAVCRSE